jgi:phenylalanyl-tRNA synthetase alpha chain
MTLADFLAQLDALASQATATLRAAAKLDALEEARIRFLGQRSGELRAVQKGLSGVDKADRPAAGKRFNEVKQAIEAALEQARTRVTGAAGPAEDLAAAGPHFDPTLGGPRVRLGHLHPITRTIEDLKDIMGRLGFTVAYGPEVEDEWHNFEALNIPLEHPARDPLDNFYLAAASPLPPGEAPASGYPGVRAPHAGPHASPHPSPLPRGEGMPGRPLLLRSQTSNVQIRVMENNRPPVRIISLGRVYRPDDADATHYPMFHQMEGLLVDRHVTMADLKSVLCLFARSFFQDDVHIRFRPSFFPFTEPSVEVDMSWHGRWIEMGGAGMVDPHVFRAVGYDPEELSGFAFGLGIERICARRHNVTDIREFFKNDVRFLEQF